MTLYSAQEENRKYSEGQAYMDGLLEELRSPPDQTAEQIEDHVTSAPPVPEKVQGTPSPGDEQTAIQPPETEKTSVESEEENRPDTFSKDAARPPENTKREKRDQPGAKNSTPASPASHTGSTPSADATGKPADMPTAIPHLIGGNTGVDLTAAKEKNSDFIAWLKIPGTNVNYPVVLSDSTDFYLTHDFNGRKSKLGTLFSLKKTDYRSPGRNIAIYGHHITNTSSGEFMFRPLLSYKKQSFYEKHSIIYLDSLYHSGIYKVFAVVNLVKGEWDPSTASFASDADFLAFIRQAQARSLYDTGVEVTASDRILTLITCDRSYAAADGRLIVLAVKQ